MEKVGKICEYPEFGKALQDSRIPEKRMATHSRILAWRIPWTEEPGGLQSMRSPRVKHY